MFYFVKSNRCFTNSSAFSLTVIVYLFRVFFIGGILRHLIFIVKDVAVSFLKMVYFRSKPLVVNLRVKEPNVTDLMKKSSYCMIV